MIDCIIYTLCYVLQIPHSEEEKRPGPSGLAKAKVRYCHSTLLQSNFKMSLLQVTAELSTVMRATPVIDCIIYTLCHVLQIPDSEEEKAPGPSELHQAKVRLCLSTLLQICTLSHSASH